MSLMIRARFKAWCHVMRYWVRLDLRAVAQHRIWRVYRHHGLQTLRVFCDCGKEFK